MTETSPPSATQKYFNRLSLPGGEASSAHKAALARAHELRKFEIENYWKRSSYFWGFQLVAFGALALSAKDGNFHPQIVLIVAVLGALAAFTAVLSAKGSKFWQENWEAHVDFLEVAIEGQLHTTALMSKGPSYSVSRVNERFLELLFAGWIVAFSAGAFALLFPGLLSLDYRTAAIVQIAIPAVALLGGISLLKFGQKSDLRGRAFNKLTMEEWLVKGAKDEPSTPDCDQRINGEQDAPAPD
jgi:hypothetical protein